MISEQEAVRSAEEAFRRLGRSGSIGFRTIHGGWRMWIADDGAGSPAGLGTRHLLVSSDGSIVTPCPAGLLDARASALLRPGGAADGVLGGANW